MPAPAAGGMADGSTRPEPGEVYLEHQVIGRALKVNAVDAATGTEITIMGPAGMSRREIEDIALRKLAYVLARAKRGGSGKDSC